MRENEIEFSKVTISFLTKINKFFYENYNKFLVFWTSVGRSRTLHASAQPLILRTPSHPRHLVAPASTRSSPPVVLVPLPPTLAIGSDLSLSLRLSELLNAMHDVCLKVKLSP